MVNRASRRASTTSTTFRDGLPFRVGATVMKGRVATALHSSVDTAVSGVLPTGVRTPLCLGMRVPIQSWPETPSRFVLCLLLL